MFFLVTVNRVRQCSFFPDYEEKGDFKWLHVFVVGDDLSASFSHLFLNPYSFDFFAIKIDAHMLAHFSTSLCFPVCIPGFHFVS